MIHLMETIAENGNGCGNVSNVIHRFFLLYAADNINLPSSMIYIKLKNTKNIMATNNYKIYFIFTLPI